MDIDLIMSLVLWSKLFC